MLLHNALAQTAWPGPTLDDDNWRDTAATKLASVDWSRARKDVLPSLERPHELDLLTLDNLQRCLARPGSPTGAP